MGRAGARDLAARERARHLSLHHAERRVLIVGHQVVVLCLRYLLENLSEAEILEIDDGDDVANCGVTAYRFDPEQGVDGALRLEVYNFLSPLKEAERPGHFGPGRCGGRAAPVPPPPAPIGLRNAEVCRPRDCPGVRAIKGVMTVRDRIAQVDVTTLSTREFGTSGHLQVARRQRARISWCYARVRAVGRTRPNNSQKDLMTDSNVASSMWSTMMAGSVAPSRQAGLE